MDAVLGTLWADKWLYETMAAYAPLAALVSTRIYADIGKQGTVLPYIIFSQQSAKDLDVIGTGNQRLFTTAIYLVKAVGGGDSHLVAGRVANQIDKAIQGKERQAVTFDGLTLNLSCYRVNPIKYAEFEDNVRHNHDGGLYRLHIE